MIVVDDVVVWSASDLTAAVDCEYGFVRRADYLLGRARPVEKAPDGLEQRIAALGDQHEQRILERYREAGTVVMPGKAMLPVTAASASAAADAAMRAFTSDADVVYQPAFFDGEFFGYADFVERTDAGWLICDAKLARSAKPQALLQLGAYADQLLGRGVPVAPTVSLLLGSGERVDVRVADVLPVFRERRERLRTLLSTHRAGDGPIGWGDDEVTACGRCAECEDAAEAHHDVILVAGVRTSQRQRFVEAGIRTIGELAESGAAPDGIPATTFEGLRAQARMQWAQLRAGDDAPVAYELTDDAASTLALLPAPSPGDLFFDFEGDPLYDEGDPDRVGLEYLWGVMDADGAYTPRWAHSRADERAALIEFLTEVAARREKYPDMHIYHYASYETSALKRLAMSNQVMEKPLDDLLRSEVFVDLYATVRGAIRVSTRSYSIKKLEPLYMGDELRSDGDDAVADGGASVVSYHEYRDLIRDDPAEAEKRLEALAAYNAYDCRSTLRLRDWLLDRATDAGVRERIVPQEKNETGEELSTGDPVFLDLMARAEPVGRAGRSAQQQAYALLATSLDYHRRESKQFWWGHYDRLSHPVGEWQRARDIFVVESARVEKDWELPAGKRNWFRTVRLTGDWTPGSRPGAALVVYPTPAPSACKGPDRAPFAAGSAVEIRAEVGPRDIELIESRKPAEVFDDLPVALMPTPPPGTDNLQKAIRSVAESVQQSAQLPDLAVTDLLAGRAPRLVDGGPLPTDGDPIANVVAALVGMTNSYVAVQGPPGTGKTYSGSRVIKELVERRRWRIGVVAQSHAVVENVLTAVVKAGLNPALVGKHKDNIKTAAPEWTAAPKIDRYLEANTETGCVVGGTAWDFTNDKKIRPGSLDLLVIDEAGQFSLANTIAVSIAADRLLLLGDPQQLPQVSQGTHAEPVDQSALGWLLGSHPTIPADRGYFLAQTHRMHPDLCARVSTLSYEDRLHSAPTASDRHLDGVEPGLHVVSVDHTGNRTESPEEADAIVAGVRSVLGAAWTESADAAPRPLEAREILVVAPYNAQVQVVRAALEQAGLPEVRVGTVDLFQGQEAPIVFVSMTASSHGDVPRGMGFLLNRNRLNVAVSRAQWACYLVRSTTLTAFMPASTAGMLELGAFIGLCTP